jgi:hypothetical protein
MERTPAGIIRKIVVGHNPKDEGMAFVVGNKFGDKLITDIVEDINQFHIFGKVRFLIYVKINGRGEHMLWKSLDGVPVTIEYDLSQSEAIV